MAKAWILTHPETKFDQQGRMHGNLDPELSWSGKFKARQMAKSFSNRGIKRILSSPRKRAVELAKALSKATGAPVEIQQALEPWDLGNISGAKAESIRPLVEFFSSRPNKAVPNGEAKRAMLDRYSGFIKQLKGGDAVVGHSQHVLAYDYAKNGGDPAKVPMIGKAGQVKQIEVKA